MTDDFFAPPPFKADDALARLRRELREAGLNEREGVFERRGKAIARAALDTDALSVAVVKKPARSPEWQARHLRSSADVRDFVALVKKNLLAWSDADD